MHKTIAILKGDGIGPEVVVQAQKVLSTIADRFNHKFEFEETLIGGIAIRETGNPLPEKTINIECTPKSPRAIYINKKVNIILRDV